MIIKKIKLLSLLFAFLETVHANEKKTHTGNDNASTKPAIPSEIQEVLDVWRRITDSQALHIKIEELLWEKFRLEKTNYQLKLSNHQLEDKLNAKAIVEEENIGLNKKIDELKQKYQHFEHEVEEKQIERERNLTLSEEIWDSHQSNEFLAKSKAIQRAIRAIELHEKVLLAISVPDFQHMYEAIKKLLKTEATDTILNLDSPSLLTLSSRKKAIYHYVRWRYALQYAKTSKRHVEYLRTEMKKMGLSEHEFCLGISNLFVSVQAWPQIYFSPIFRPSAAGSLTALSETRLNDTFSDEPIILKSIETILVVQKREHDEFCEQLSRPRPTLTTLPFSGETFMY